MPCRVSTRTSALGRLRDAIGSAITAVHDGNQVFVFRDPPDWSGIDASGAPAVDAVSAALIEAERLGTGTAGGPTGRCAGQRLDPGPVESPAVIPSQGWRA